MTPQENIISAQIDGGLHEKQALLDDFAKAAMQGHIASEYYVLNGDRKNYEALAKEFYAFADALMQERERRIRG